MWIPFVEKFFQASVDLEHDRYLFAFIWKFIPFFYQILITVFFETLNEYFFKKMNFWFEQFFFYLVMFGISARKTEYTLKLTRPQLGAML